MVIERVDPRPQVKQFTQSLGHVQVTIDDLQALLGILKPMQHLDIDDNLNHRWIDLPIKFEFDGGSFTQPEELRKLSDDEIASLKIRARGVQVILNPSQAVAIGEEEECRRILGLWARGRQVPLPPRTSGLPLVSYYQLGVGIFALLFSGLAVYFTGIWLLATVFATPGVILVGLSFMTRAAGKASAAKRTSAAIRAVSLDELRRTQAADDYPRQGWIVAIHTAAISFLALVVAIIVAVLDKSP